MANSLCAQQPADTNYVNELRSSAWGLRRTNPDSAKTIAQKALTLAQKHSFTSIEARVLLTIGVIEKYQNQLDNSLQSCYKSLKVYNTIDEPVHKGQCLMNIGTIYRHLTNFDSAQAYYLQALDLFEKTQDQVNIASLCMNLGNLHSTLGQFEPAQKFYTRTLSIQLALNDSTRLATTYNNLGLLHINLVQYDSAIFYLEESLKIQEQINNPRSLANLYNNLGATYEGKKEFQTAESYYLKCLPIYEAMPSYSGLIGSYINLCSASIEFQNPAKASKYLNLAIAISEEKNIHTYDAELYQSQSAIQQELGNYKAALEYYAAYKAIKDSLLNETITQQIAETREKYEAEKREQEIAFHEEKDAVQDQLIVQEQLANDRKTLLLYLSIGGATLAITALLLLLRNQRLRRKAEQLHAKEQDNRRRTEIAGLMQEQEVLSLSSMLEGQEKERKRIATDLHDNLGSMLSTVKLHFQVLDSRVEDLATADQEQFYRAEELLDEACGEVRRIAHDMVSGVLTKFGLVAALEKLQASIEVQGKLKMLVLAYGLDERLDSASELTLYRIIQELVGNILKHADASEITVQLNRIENTLNVQVEDNGAGFDVKTAQSKDGIGLKNVNARVHSLQGEIHLDSSPGHGSTITIDIPLI